MNHNNRKGRRLLKRLQAKSDKNTVDIDYLIFGAPGTDQNCILGRGHDGTVFVPAVMHPSGPDGAFTKAGLDKVAIGQHKGFLYVPSDWLCKQLAGDEQESAKVAVIRRMESAVQAHRLAQAETSL